ncbi:hypothetical protein K788_0005146 [Paraburkholderia caribensis MBA4]|uniref:Uncharacterized protein n=1 Tax=Paraburkholderia caribensis MBA4 TaxID=1323664 RepID=A0A0P0RFB9_9BURK|nr:hypothetical protein K788_0005146 [Paraburkholderia caribensis MBA4]
MSLPQVDAVARLDASPGRLLIVCKWVHSIALRPARVCTAWHPACNDTVLPRKTPGVLTIRACCRVPPMR